MDNPNARNHFLVAGRDPVSPADRADGLALLANEFLTVGKSAPDTCPFAKYFNVYHAIEAALKSYLARSGMTEHELQKLGHNIKTITAKAGQLGFALHADEKTVLHGFRVLGRRSVHSDAISLFWFTELPEVGELDACG